MIGKSAMRFRAPALAAFLFFASDADAQLHWDASAQAGISRRVLARAPGDDASFGPIGQLAAHVALVPFVHLGAYAGVEHSTVGESSRNIGFAGARAKGMIPGLQGAVRAWLFAGVGYALAYGTSRRTTVLVPNGMGGTEPRSGRIEGASGGFIEVPFGIGASYTFFKPWALAIELGARVGVAHSGALYDGPTLTLDSGLPQRSAPDGLDRFGLGLVLGILYDR
jgi:hypothetical protein